MAVKSPVLLLVLALSALPAHAHEPELRYNRASFSVSATEDVANDTLVAVLAAQRDGGSARQLATEVAQAGARLPVEVVTVAHLPVARLDRPVAAPATAASRSVCEVWPTLRLTTAS